MGNLYILIRLLNNRKYNIMMHKHKDVYGMVNIV